MSSAPKHVAKWLPIAWFTIFLVGTDLFVISPLLPLIGRELGYQPASLAVLVSAFSLTYAIACPLQGRLAERCGARGVLLFGIAALAAANAYTALATSLAHLLASRVLAGFAAASISPMLYALAAEHAETERRASRMAQVNSGLVIALGLGAPFGLLVGDIGNWRLVFLGLASALTLMLPLNMRAWRTAGGPPPRAAQGAAAAPESLLQAWPHLLTMTAWASSVYAGYTLLATALGREHAADAGHIAALLSSFGCGAALGVLLGGKIADRIGSWPMVQAALLAMSAIFAALAWLWSAASLPVLAAGLFLLALSAYGFFPAAQAHAAQHFPRRRTTVLGMMSSALYLGITIGAAAGAQRFQHAGMPAVLCLSAVLAGLGALAARAHGRRQGRPSPRIA